MTRSSTVTMQERTSNASEGITLITFLRDDATRTARHVQLSIHDTIPDLFAKCAAAWPQALRSANDIQRLCYIEDVYLIEVVRGWERDLQYLRDNVRRGQVDGRGSRVEVYLWGPKMDADVLVGGVERLSL